MSGTSFSGRKRDPNATCSRPDRYKENNKTKVSNSALPVAPRYLPNEAKVYFNHYAKVLHDKGISDKHDDNALSMLAIAHVKLDNANELIDLHGTFYMANGLAKAYPFVKDQQDSLNFISKQLILFDLSPINRKPEEQEDDLEALLSV